MSAVESARPSRPGRLRLAVAARNFGPAPALDCLEKAARIGLDAVDNFNWRDPEEFQIYARNLPRLGLAAGVVVVNKIPDVNALGCSLTLPEDREGFLTELRLAIAAARQLGCTRLEVLTGNRVPGATLDEHLESCTATLRAAVPLLEDNGMLAVVEMLNAIECPDYFLTYLKDGVELVRRVDSPHVKLLFDIYHVQIMEGNLIERIRSHAGYIGQFHFADVPGRREPGTGEINFRNVFRAIYDLGGRYDGHVTAEYHPTDLSMRDLEEVRRLTTFE